MSFPNYQEKHTSQAVFSPKRVNEERRRIGLWPSRLDAVGAIVCYDPTLWEKVTAWPSRVACDGWLEGAFLLPFGEHRVLVMKATGVGAPTSVITLEELIAAGFGRIVNLGSAGALQAQMKIGDLIVCEAAIRDEGTSHHYLPDAKFAYPCPTLTSELCAAIERAGIPFQKGVSWTTDAPYRETIDEVRCYREEGVTTVEMEAAALFTVGGVRGASVASVFVISDLVSEAGWEHAFKTEALQSALVEIFEIALETLASSPKPP
jgi:uridine phosphorylase